MKDVLIPLAAAFALIVLEAVVATINDIREDREQMKGALMCCKTCKYHEHETVSDGWVCVNTDSSHCTDWTDDDMGCREWKEKT